MDNFLTWVDAPSEALIPTPVEDESNNYLRDEILQTQQLVIDKLDEQKINDTEDEDKSMDDSMVAVRLLDELRDEARRSEAVNIAMTGFQKDCRNNELRLVSLKQSFPKSDMVSENYEKEIDDMNYEVRRFQDLLRSRENELLKRQQGMPETQKDQEKRKLIKLKESYLESRQKHELLRTLRVSNLKLQKQLDQASHRQVKLKKEFETAQATVKMEESKLEKLNDENASMRAKLVQLESARSTNNKDSNAKTIERLRSEAERIRLDTAKAQVRIEAVKAQATEVQKIVEEMPDSVHLKEKAEKISALATLLRQKLQQVKEKARKEDAHRKMLELKTAINEENAELVRNRQELEEMLPGKSKNVDELKNEIATMEAHNRGKDKKIREAVKENDKLIEEIAKMNVRTEDSSLSILDRTEDIQFQDKGDITLEIPTKTSEKWKSAPRLPLDVTPIHAPAQEREPSVDAITGIPPVKEWMTSTPLHPTRKRNSSTKLEKTLKKEKPEKPEKTKKLEKAEKAEKPEKPENKTMRTRGAARRLAENAAAKTENIRKKKVKN